MSIKDEFEKAKKERWGLIIWSDDIPANQALELDIAIWGAKWMAERIAKRSGLWGKDDLVIEEIMELAKEL